MRVVGGLVMIMGACVTACFPLPPGADRIAFSCEEDVDCWHGLVCDPVTRTCVSPDQVSAVDGGGTDGGANDAGRLDAGRRPDGGRRDAGVPDAARRDAAGNHAPTFTPLDNMAADEGTTITGVRVAVGDIDGDDVSVSVRTSVPEVVATLTPEPVPGRFNLDLVPEPDFFGLVEVSLVASDGAEDTPFNLWVRLRQVNDPPSFTVERPVLALDEDLGAASFARVVSHVSPGPREKEVQGVDLSARLFQRDGGLPNIPLDVPPSITAAGTLEFTTRPDVFGEFSVEITATDTGVPPLSVTDVVTVTVRPVNDAPTLVTKDPPPSIYPNSPRSMFHGEVDLLVTDIENDPSTLVAQAVDPAQGTCEMLSGLRLRLTPSPYVTGPVACIVSATDVPAVGTSQTSQLEVTFMVEEPLPSCRTLYTRPGGSTLPDGHYLVRAELGSGEAYEVYCDMANGGWTLAMKVADGTNEAEYDHPFWTDAAGISDVPDPTPGTSARFRPFTDLAFNEMRVVLSPRPGATGVTAGARELAVGGANLRDLFALGGWVRTPKPRGRAAWIGMVGAQDSDLQPACNREGINVPSAGSSPLRVRMGLLADATGACLLPDTALGIGLDQELCAGLTVGLADCRVQPARRQSMDALVFIRDTGVVTQRPRASCLQHKLAGFNADGLYPLQSPGGRAYLARCEMDLRGGGWTLLAVNAQEAAAADRILTWEALTASAALGTASLDEDHRSQAANDLGFHDLMFTSRDEQRWVVYEGVSNGLPLTQWLQGYDSLACGTVAPRSFHAAAHSMTDPRLCDHTLFLSVKDQDGINDACNNDDNPAWGPAWSINSNQGCPLDDPQLAAFTAQSPSNRVPLGPGPAQMWAREGDFTSLGPAPSCQAHLEAGRRFSGLYQVAGVGTRFCRMTDTLAWMRVADVDMGHDAQCPPGWRQAFIPRGCARAANGTTGLQRSAYFEVGMPYSQVSGWVRALQQGSTDAFHRVAITTPTLENEYVDGVSITVGAAGLRRHVFTYASGYRDSGGLLSACPCNGGTGAPGFVGNQHACDTGVSATDVPVGGAVMSANGLFDGVATNSCAGAGNLGRDPWDFVASIGAAETDALEVRIIGDEDSLNEDILVTDLELYVR